jgi:glycerol-3-phosphate acyltransferase PlsX
MDCKPLYLEQFAVMGSVYMEKVLGFNNPKVGLINVGVEEEKGNDLTKTVHAMLKGNKTINFMGNVEARELMTGDVEVAVCDGFAGNLCLKTAEGMGSFIFKLMKENMTKGFRNKLGALLLKPALKELKKKFDYSEYGGAPLLGIDGVVIKAHGSTDAKIAEITIMQAVNMVEKDIISVIKTNIEALNNTDEN